MIILYDPLISHKEAITLRIYDFVLLDSSHSEQMEFILIIRLFC